MLHNLKYDIEKTEGFVLSAVAEDLVLLIISICNFMGIPQSCASSCFIPATIRKSPP